MKKATTTTSATTKTILTASEYFARKRAGEIAPGTGKRTRKPGAPLDAVDYFAHKRKGEIAPGTSKPIKSANKPETSKPNKTTSKPEKPAKMANNKPITSPERLNASKPNKGTNKPGKREQARENMTAFKETLATITDKENRGIIDYSDTMPGLYRLQFVINGKLKTIARVKLQRDIYILVRENVAELLGVDYDLINYNLPAGYHVEYKDGKKEIEKLFKLFETGAALK